MKTITIGELITRLTQIKNQIGDIKVFLSSDEEGNEYHTIHSDTDNFDSFAITEAMNQTENKPETILIIYPWEHVEELS